MLASGSVVEDLIDLGIIENASRRGQAGYQVRLSALSTYPGELRQLIREAAEHVRRLPEEFDAVAATSTATLHVTSLLADRLHLPMVYLRPKPKAHGKQKQIEGHLASGARVLLVAEPSASADAVHGWAGIIREQGARVQRCLWLVEPEIAAPGTPSPTSECPSSVLIDRWQIDEIRSRHAAPPLGIHDPHARGALGPSNLRPEFADPRVRARAVAQALLGIGAVTINRATPYRYASGLLSPIYTDNRLLISHPDEWSTVIAAFLSALERDLRSDRTDLLVGMATSGIPHASLIADAANLPLGYVEFDDGAAHLDGGLARLAGDARRAMIIEDHITTGGSVIKTALALRDAGFSISQCVAIFTYERPQARANFDQHALPVTPLCDLGTLLDLAVEIGVTGPQERAAVYEWLEDPEGWTAREERRLVEAGAA